MIGSADWRSPREAAAFTASSRCVVEEVDPLAARLGSADASNDAGWLPTRTPAATNDATTAISGRLCNCRAVLLCLLRPPVKNERLLSTVRPLGVDMGPRGKR